MEPDIQLVDLQVLRQAGIPEPVLFLAVRKAQRVEAPGPGTPVMGGRNTGLDVAFLDEFEEDPDKRPYTWDLPDDCN